ncbi:hypothetical protein BpHYR1_033324 [Brachionus plicatilis]|uniref:Uncharacterized protein n=1 Tax=Brachionus plicatilis TaxID=10195 RepID=A0A3M7PJ87_BRAPC|nr:hypothetical protein BpHYR1_033324 [Brachionus plicatilis]
MKSPRLILEEPYGIDKNFLEINPQNLILEKFALNIHKIALAAYLTHLNGNYSTGTALFCDGPATYPLGRLIYRR